MQQGYACLDQTGTFVRSLCATFNEATFETFLKTLLRHLAHGTRMVLVLDNVRYHHAILLKPVLRKYRTVLTLNPEKQLLCQESRKILVEETMWLI